MRDVFLTKNSKAEFKPSDGQKKVILRIAAFFFLLSLITFYRYFTQEYIPFISSEFSLDTYIPAGLRFICRLGYPIAAIAIFFLQMWGAWLLVIVWLIQLVPSGIYSLLYTGSVNADWIFSLVTFIISAGLLYVCRSALKKDKLAKYLVIYFLAALALHSILFFINSGTNKVSEGGYHLMAAVRRNDLSAVENYLKDPEVIKKELNAKCPPYTRCKPITFAAENGNLAILKMLLDAGADPDGATSYGDTPLIIALMNNQIEVVDILLEYKADVNKTNQFGASPLMGGVWNGDKKLVEKFIANGADVNQTFPFMNPTTEQLQENTSPLSLAVQMDKAEIAEILMQNKASQTIRDSLGKTVADYAKESKNSKIRKLFNGQTF